MVHESPMGCKTKLAAFCSLIVACSGNRSDSGGSADAGESDAGVPIDELRSPDQLWTAKTSSALRRLNWPFVADMPVFEVDDARLAAIREDIASGASDVWLPVAARTYSRFRLYEDSPFSAELALAEPSVRFYRGAGVDDPSLEALVQLSGEDLSAAIDGPDGDRQLGEFGDAFLLTAGEDAPKGQGCGVDRSLLKAVPAKPAGRRPAPNDKLLRTYRIAIAATGEYVAAVVAKAQDAGEPTTDPETLALVEIGRTLQIVNEIYERELGIRFELVARERDVIFLDAASDPYHGADQELLDQNQATLDAVIGHENYDLGHLFTIEGTSWGLPGACGKHKAEGLSARSEPWGTAFAVDYVAHEIGHQLDATHIFSTDNDLCGKYRWDATAFEPGSGSTILSYAGICGADDVQEHADPYFNAVNLRQILLFVSSQDGRCRRGKPSPNRSAPTVSGGPDLWIPPSTPFTLHAAASDADGDVITCVWEMSNAAPTVRSRPGCDRAVPSIQTLAEGFAATTFDPVRLPVAGETLSMRVSARDGRGRFAADDVLVRIAKGEPFEVSAPAAGEEWLSGATRTVTWSPADTARAPVKCQKVSIRLVDPQTAVFVAVLATGTANDGEETVRLPTLPGPRVLLKVHVACDTQPFFQLAPGHVGSS